MESLKLLNQNPPIKPGGDYWSPWSCGRWENGFVSGCGGCGLENVGATTDLTAQLIVKYHYQ